MSPWRSWSAEMLRSMRSLLPAFAELGNELLLLRLQARFSHGFQKSARLLGFALLDENVRGVEPHRLLLDRRRRFFLERAPGFQRTLPIRLLEVVERFRVTIRELEAIGRELRRALECLLHRPVDRGTRPLAALDEIV